MMVHPVGPAASSGAVFVNAAKDRTVITALASAILSNYGKALVLLLGTACVAFYLLREKPSSHDPNDSALGDEKKTSSKELEPAVDLGFQHLKPSSELPAEMQVEIQKIITLFARHEVLFIPMEKRLPGLMEEIRRALTSNNFEDIQAWESRLSQSDEKRPLAGVKLGQHPWIIPKGEDNFEFTSKGGRNFILITSDQTTFRQMGIEEAKIPPLDEKFTLMFEVKNNQVIKAYHAIKPHEAPLEIDLPKTSIEYVKMPEKMPKIPEKFSPQEKLITQILINTIWLQDNIKRGGLKRALSLESFPKVLNELQSLITNHSHFLKYQSTEYHDLIEIPPKVDLDKLLQFVENKDTPHLAVFQLQAIKDHFSKNGVIIYGPDQRQIFLTMAEYAKLHNNIRDWLDLKKKEFISYEKVQKVYLDEDHVNFTLFGDTREHKYLEAKQYRGNFWRRVTWKEQAH
jgi:hypothetical protein